MSHALYSTVQYIKKEARSLSTLNNERDFHTALNGHSTILNITINTDITNYKTGPFFW